VRCVMWRKTVEFQHPCRIIFLFFSFVNSCLSVVIGRVSTFSRFMRFFPSASSSYPADQASFLPHVTGTHIKHLGETAEIQSIFSRASLDLVKFVIASSVRNTHRHGFLICRTLQILSCGILHSMNSNTTDIPAPLSSCTS
jgi:hypothetical protein